VFVGPNGGGKSALFDALLNFSMLSRGNLKQAFGPYPFSFKSTIFRGASKVSKIGFRVVMSKNREDKSSLEYEIDYAQTGLGEDHLQFVVNHERLISHPEEKVIFDRSDPDIYQIAKSVSLENDRSLLAAVRYSQSQGAEINNELLAYCAQQVSRFNKFRLDASILGLPTRLPDPSGEVLPRLGYHGEDLAATLFHLQETQDPALTAIRATLREIDSQFVDFEFSAVGTDRIAFAVNYSDPRGTVQAIRLSAGTLIAIGLITLVLTPNRPPVLMIEEPENGLTPQAIRVFYKSIRDLALNVDPAKRSQVLISSHSPFMICDAWNGDDREFIYQVKVEGGHAVVRRFGDVVRATGIQLQKEKSGDRLILGLRNAEEIMSGYLS